MGLARKIACRLDTIVLKGNKDFNSGYNACKKNIITVLDSINFIEIPDEVNLSDILNRYNKIKRAKMKFDTIHYENEIIVMSKLGKLFTIEITHGNYGGIIKDINIQYSTDMHYIYELQYYKVLVTDNIYNYHLENQL